MTDLEGLLRELRSEIRTEVSQLRTDMTAAFARIEERTVQRGEYVAQLAALEHRVTVLEEARTRTTNNALTGLVYPLLVGLLLAVVAYLIARGRA